MTASPVCAQCGASLFFERRPREVLAGELCPACITRGYPWINRDGDRLSCRRCWASARIVGAGAMLGRVAEAFVRQHKACRPGAPV